MLGLGLPWQNAETDAQWYDRTLEAFKPAFWYNWKHDQIGCAGYRPMLFHMDRPSLEEAAPLVDSSHTWLLGNEPEYSHQSDTTPQEAARTAQTWREQDLGLGIWPGVMATVRGRTWIRDFLDCGGPIPDLWHVHIFAWTAPEARRIWDDWRSFMATYDVERLTIISEFAGWDIKPERQMAIMSEVDRLITQDPMLHSASWFSAHYGRYENWWRRSDLMDGAGNLTTLGEHYRTVNATQAGEHVYLPAVHVT